MSGLVKAIFILQGVWKILKSMGGLWGGTKAKIGAKEVKDLVTSESLSNSRLNFALILFALLAIVNLLNLSQERSTSEWIKLIVLK